ncbi:hypothetical protein WJX72_007513 [[Myrmecia] bisecta]|uniref:Uncharacterized protein n=1 Tax=[Myrmecia] bisecta TaxID=41462 RepID=A0AAW1PDT0_9CHLO
MDTADEAVQALLQELEVPTCVAALVSAAKKYVAGVDTLRGPLEADVREAADACWIQEEKSVQVRSKLMFKRTVKVLDATFIEEAEQQLLGAALDKWQSAAEGAVAATALQMRIAERCLLHTVHRLLNAQPQRAGAILALLDCLLGSVATMGAPIMISSPTTFSTIKTLALYTGMRFLETASGEADGTHKQLLRVGAQESGAIGLKAQCILLTQFPWHQVGELQSDIVQTSVLAPLTSLLNRVTQQAGTGDDDVDEVVDTALTLLGLVAEHVPSLRDDVHWAILVAILAVARGGSVQDAMSALGMQAGAGDVTQVGILDWAGTVWSNNGPQGARLAAQMVQSVAWEQTIPKLPGALQLRVLMMLMAVAKAVVNAAPLGTSQDFVAWLWKLLQGPTGHALTAFAAADGVGEDVHMLCMTEAPPGGQRGMQALWAWSQISLGVGLVELWAADQADGGQAARHTEALLEGMQLGGLAQALVAVGQEEVLGALLVRLFKALITFGDEFFSNGQLSEAGDAQDAALGLDLDLTDPLLQLRLSQIISAADLQLLAARIDLSATPEAGSGVPFLLQPLLDAPTLVQGNPGPRIVRCAELLTDAARLNGSAQAAGLAASLIQQLLLASVGQGSCAADRGNAAGAFQWEDDEADAAPGSGSTDCWHLTAEEHSMLVLDCLIPLAQVHASFDLAANAGAGLAEGSDAASRRSTKTHGASEAAPPPSPTPKWQPPQLSQLVTRLGERKSSTGLEAVSLTDSPKRAPVDKLFAAAEPVPAHAAPAAPAPQDPAALAHFVAAAAPIRSLILSVCTPPRTLTTPQPLPFANARKPLGADVAPANARVASSAAASTSGSESPKSLKSRMAEFGRAKPKGASPKAAAAPLLDAQAIQEHLASLIQDACLGGSLELPLCILRLMFSAPELRSTPVAEDLMEDLVVSVLLAQHGPGSEAGQLLELEDQRSPSYTQQSLVSLDDTEPYSYTQQSLVSLDDTEPPTAVGRGVPPAVDVISLLLGTLGGSADDAVLDLARSAATAKSPVTLALATEKLRQLALARETMAWRAAVTEVIEMSAMVDARPEAPIHVVAVWLGVLQWLADARWRKLRSTAPTDQLEALLDALQRHVGVLKLAEIPPELQPGSDASAAERVRAVRLNFNARLNRAGQTPSTPTSTPTSVSAFDPARSATWADPNAAAAALEEVPGKEGKPSSSWGGFKSMLGRSKPDEEPRKAAVPAVPAVPAGKGSGLRGKLFGGHQPLPTIYGSGSDDSGPDSPTKVGRQHSAAAPPVEAAKPADSPAKKKSGFRSLLSRASGATDAKEASSSAPAEDRPAQAPGTEAAAKAKAGGGRLAGLRRALHRNKGEAEGSPDAQHAQQGADMAAEVAADTLISIGLAAFAVSAFIKSVLCPSLASYTPRASASSQWAGVFRGNSIASTPTAASGTTPFSAGFVLHSSRGSLGSLRSLDDPMMRELDQVVEARAELDSLEEILHSPLLASRPDRYANFFASAGRLLQPSTSVEVFESELQALLFPNAPYLHRLSTPTVDRRLTEY